jgi:hypothetical protein
VIIDVPEADAWSVVDATVASLLVQNPVPEENLTPSFWA